MYGERLLNSVLNHSETVRVEGRVLKDDQVRRLLGVEHDSGLDGIQPYALGYDKQNRITGMVPMVLTNLEEDESKTDSDHFKAMLAEVVKTAKPEFGLKKD